nr:DNA internalization-related competence protein ComEC/Rec2 [Neptunicella marina]
MVLIALVCCMHTKWRFVTGLITGMLWLQFNAYHATNWTLPSLLISKTLQVEGQVHTLVTPDESLRFTLKVHKINGLNIKSDNVKVRISWHQPAFIPGQGQTLLMQLRLKPAHSLANDVGFHYQQWLISKGIRATGYQVSQLRPKIIDDSISWRQSLLNTLIELNLKNKGWIAALTLGYRGLLDTQDWTLLQHTGVAHLVAISGLHLGIVASLVFLLLPLCLAPFSRKQTNLRLISAVFATIVACLYSFLAGMSLPTLRACLMLVLVSVLMIYAKHLGLRRLIICCCALVLLVSPLSILTASFWLSFYAVCLIGVILWKWPVTSQSGGNWQRFLIAARLQLGLCILMIPMVAWQFGFISLISPLANFLAVPLVTLIMVPVCLAGLCLLPVYPAGAQYLFGLVDKAITLGVKGLSYLSESVAVMQVPAPPLAVWFMMGIGLFICIIPAFKWRGLIAVLLCVPFLSYLMPVFSEQWRIEVLDVGQGAAAVVSRNGKTIVIDTGPSYNSGFNMADAVILPLIQRKGLQAPDYIFITHHDMDHDGSLRPLSTHYPDAKVMSNTDSCVHGKQLKWQSLTIRLLWPPAALKESENNRSCVIHISDGHHSVLFAGDIERKSELELVEKTPIQLKADILLVPHHGSKSSSSTAFIQRVMPEFAVFSTGYLNRWQFPRPEVVKRYKDNHIVTLNTAKTGQISFIIERTIKVKTFRKDTLPYWYANQ